VTHTTGERLWIAYAPTGVPSPGPAVCRLQHVADEYRRMGWEVKGPYVPAADLARAEAEIKELLRLIDDDTQDFKHRVDVVQAVHKAAALAKGGDESA
jgi:hypothetical protein